VLLPTSCSWPGSKGAGLGEAPRTVHDRARQIKTVPAAARCLNDGRGSGRAGVETEMGRTIDAESGLGRGIGGVRDSGVVSATIW
jgi:hypothetical protein